MNCQNCGMNVDGNACCPRCGVPISNPVKHNYSNNRPMVRQGNPTNVLVYCILSLVLSRFGIVGMIFSILGFRKANAYIAAYGNISTQVRIARGLAIVGMVVGLIATFLWVFAIHYLIFR